MFNDDMILWYRQPAKDWVEALPISNGRLGAMVFGGIQHERIQLNEGSLWSGKPNAWPDGCFRGLRARGGAEVDLTWREGKATSAVLKASVTSKHRLRPPCGQRITDIRCGEETLALQHDKRGMIFFDAKAGQTYEIIFR